MLGQPALRAITASTALTNLLWAAAATVQLLASPLRRPASEVRRGRRQ